MADFVAVIRRTVDGLSDNVPDMRSKVYEKARGAVRRQLENMKPRPSDDMIERQMVKLEAAIAEVESDYAEALPPIDDAEVAPFAHEEPLAAEPEAVYEEPVASEPAVEPEPEPEPVAEVEPQAEAEVLPEPVPAVEEQVADEPQPAQEDAPVYEVPASETLEAAPVAQSSEPEPVVPEPEPVAYDNEPAPQDEPHVVAPVYEEPAELVEPVSSEVHVDAEPAASYPEDDWSVVPEPVAPVDPVEEVPVDTPAPASEWELPEWERDAPVAASAAVEPVWTEGVDGDADGKVLDLADYMPPEPVSADQAPAQGPSEPSHSWDWDDSDPFQQPTGKAPVEGSEPAISDWSWPVEKPAAVETPAALPTAHWDDLDRLLDKGEPEQEAAAPSVPDPEPMAAPAKPVSYRVERKRSGFNFKVAGIAAVLLLALGGSGYAYWLNRDAVNEWVSGTIASVTTSAPVQTTTETPATTEPATETPEATNTASPAQTETASVDGASTKFNQRLQADGSELDGGPAPLPEGEGAAQAEGKSVAAQTDAGTPVAQANTGAAATDPATGQAPATTDGQAPAQANVQIPEGAQKMFLYEERLGQSSPTAIEGTVAWTLKEESPGNDAPPEPTIQAQINVPERGLTALMTVKRNTDSSLPASHVIEFVFSLPENFEGGAIDSVQRVSMKQNEQARGDALIAVPAKITDDFHMIALNDYPEAVATNTELLRTRSWIDVPLTYRNGRRALLTLEKGPAGTEAFTKALQAWSRAAPPASGQ